MMDVALGDGDQFISAGHHLPEVIEGDVGHRRVRPLDRSRRRVFGWEWYAVGDTESINSEGLHPVGVDVYVSVSRPEFLERDVGAVRQGFPRGKIPRIGPPWLISD